MKTKNLLSIMLSLSMLLTASVVFTSCEKDRNNPSSGYTNTDNGDNDGNGSNNGRNNGDNDDNGGGNNGGYNDGDNGGGNGGGTNSKIVETLEVMNISSTSAVFKGRINNAGGELGEYGFIYSRLSDALYLSYVGNGNVAKKAAFNDSNPETFTYKAEWLDKGRIYYVRAYAEVDGTTYYGSTLQFTTISDECYIKHPWANGEWTWKKMEKTGKNTFTYEGRWGGEGANINTTPDDAGAMWFPVNKISGAPEFDYVTGKGIFTYDAANGVLSFQIID